MIADFTWVSLGDIVLSAPAVVLLRNFKGWEPTDVHVAESGWIRTSRRGRELADATENLRELWVGVWIDPHELTTSKLKLECGTCGKKFVQILGIEHVESVDSPPNARLKGPVYRKVPRVKGQGLFVSSTVLHENDVDVFRVHALPYDVICTDRVKCAIEEAKLTNVAFAEVGDCI